MESGKYILDTNIIIALFKNDESVKKHLLELNEIFIPSIVLGELYYGAFNSKLINDNIQKIDELRKVSSVLLCDQYTSLEYGKIKAELKSKGKPMPENDIWIASITKQHNLILVTRDDHFFNVEEVKITRW
jgi:tRNA(fMet)-specific endonuclease VapC